MKIIIVGGGIAGLSTYLYLRKNLPNPPAPSPPHTIHIYESHRPSSSPSTDPTNNLNTQTIASLSSSTAMVGGGLGISPNGMRILHDLSPEIHTAVTAQGFPCDKFIFMGENGWILGMQRTGDRGGYEGVEAREEVCVSSLRGGLWECLMGGVGEGVVRYGRVKEVRVRDDASGKKVVGFEDGREEEYDLVVGADGVKSVVRRALFGGDEGDGKFGPVYTGASGIGGVIHGPLPSRVADNKAMVFTFGREGFFGYASSGPASANSLMWWSTFETDSLPSRTTKLDTEEIKAELKKRHGGAADPVVRDIISKAEVESIYPTWVMPDLPHWGENGIVLIGDAAHALSPTTGQGASQALEDAQTLSLLLAETLKKAYEPADGDSHETLAGKEKAAIALTLKLLYEIRHDRVKAIGERGRKMDKGKRKMGVVEEYAMYCFLKVMMSFIFIAKFVLGDVNAQLYGWSAKAEVKKALGSLESKL